MILDPLYTNDFGFSIHIHLYPISKISPKSKMSVPTKKDLPNYLKDPRLKYGFSDYLIWSVFLRKLLKI